VVTGDLGGALEILQQAATTSVGTSVTSVEPSSDMLQDQQGSRFEGSAGFMSVGVEGHEAGHHSLLVGSVLKKVATERDGVASGLKALLAQVGEGAEAKVTAVSAGSLAGSVLQLQVV
jgi:hypothetical protein